jgi:hypothetical protein
LFALEDTIVGRILVDRNLVADILQTAVHILVGDMRAVHIPGVGDILDVGKPLTMLKQNNKKSGQKSLLRCLRVRLYIIIKSQIILLICRYGQKRAI